MRANGKIYTVLRLCTAMLAGEALLGANTQSGAQAIPGGTCKPVAARTGEVGCWILGHVPIGRLSGSSAYWYLDRYPTRAAAEAAATAHGAVIDALGETWLLTVEAAGWQSAGGERVAIIGPLPLSGDHDYSAQYMEAVFMPGMTSATHRHSGPEAWYTEAGETCLETPNGAQTGRAGGPPVIVPGGLPMHLTATGSTQRRAIVLILHDAAQPSTTLDHEWQPKGLCR